MVTGKGNSVSYVRKCALPILKCLQLLKRENIMHSDLKPVGVTLISHPHCQQIVFTCEPLAQLFTPSRLLL